jgi:hypothetical protein
MAESRVQIFRCLTVKAIKAVIDDDFTIYVLCGKEGEVVP